MENSEDQGDQIPNLCHYVLAKKFAGTIDPEC